MSQAHNRITAYHWYLGSAFWRERRATVQETAWSRNLSVMMWRCPVVRRVHRPLTFFAK